MNSSDEAHCCCICNCNVSLSVTFSDESRFCLDFIDGELVTGDSQRVVCRHLYERTRHIWGRQRYGTVWSDKISTYWLILAVIPCTLTRQRYENYILMLHTDVYFSRIVLYNTSIASRSCLQSEHVNTLDSPSWSPYLSAIETSMGHFRPHGA